MSTADELINHFLNKTKSIHDAISKIDNFTYSYDICATLKDNKTAHITLDELDKLWGFFLVKAAYKTKDITYIVSFGDKDFALFYEVETKSFFSRHTYSIDYYTKALNFHSRRVKTSVKYTSKSATNSMKKQGSCSLLL